MRWVGLRRADAHLDLDGATDVCVNERADLRDDPGQEALGGLHVVLAFRLQKKNQRAGENLGCGREIAPVHELFAEGPKPKGVPMEVLFFAGFSRFPAQFPTRLA